MTHETCSTCNTQPQIKNIIQTSPVVVQNMVEGDHHLRKRPHSPLILGMCVSIKNILFVLVIDDFRYDRWDLAEYRVFRVQNVCTSGGIYKLYAQRKQSRILYLQVLVDLGKREIGLCDRPQMIAGHGTTHTNQHGHRLQRNFHFKIHAGKEGFSSMDCDKLAALLLTGQMLGLKIFVYLHDFNMGIS